MIAAFVVRSRPFQPRTALAAACLAAAGPALCAQRDVVVFNRAGQGYPHRDLSVYDLRLQRYTDEQIDRSFCTRLAGAAMLYIGQYAGDTAGKAVFGDPERSAAVAALLKRGGMLFFDYNAGVWDKATRAFFDGLAVKLPGYPKGKDYWCVPASGSSLRFLRTPHKLKGRTDKAHGWWEKWPAEYDAAFRDAGDPGRAAMLVRTGVAGIGTVVLSRMPGVFRRKNKETKRLAENIIASVFGPLPGPGRTVAVYDSFRNREPAANVLYLKNAGRMRWHFENADFRIPFLLAEPIGMARPVAPVTATFDLPPGAARDSVLVSTAWGKPLRCDVGEGGGRLRCTFETDLSAGGTRVMFLYCGKTPVRRPHAPDGFAVIEKDDACVLRNDKIRVTLYGNRVGIAEIKPAGSDTRNELATWGDIDLGKGNWISLTGGGGIHPGQPGGCETAVLEDGSVRKRVRQSSPKFDVTYTLYAGSPVLFYSVRAEEPLAFKRFTGWAPYGDGDEDTLFYETAAGLKKLRLQADRFYRPLNAFRQFMKEGWLAIEDARGEVVGEFADWPLLRRLTVAHHSVNGQSVLAYGRLDARTPAYGALIAAQGDHTVVRNAYVAWKNPPTVVLGSAQSRDRFAPPSPPRLGKDFALIQGPLYWFHATNLVGDSKLRVDRLLTEMERYGGNLVNASSKRPTDLSPLVTEAHRRGIGVFVRPQVPKTKRCPVANRATYLEATRKAASFNPDGVYLLDEFEFHGMCDVCRQTFRKRYGTEMPKRMDFGKLREPAYHNFILYKMNVITDLIREMTDVVRARRPDAFTFHVTSPNNHYRLIGYHDLGKHADHVTTTCSDLYSTDLNATRYMTQHIRGALGNDKPVLTVNGCLWTARETLVNAKQHLLAGTNALWHFSFNFVRQHRPVTEANADVFRWLTYTGLGKILARCHPVRYLGVLRDRDAFLDSLRRGESTGKLTDYESRIRELSLMRNVPTDILFSRYLSPGVLARYRVVIVPSERVLSAARARLLADYARRGGSLIIEGETARNPTIAALAGIQSTEGNMVKVSSLKGARAPLGRIDAEVTSSMVPVTVRNAAVLATADGRPAITLARAGRGQVACVALKRLPVGTVKRLVRSLGGRRPLEPPEDLEEKIDTSVLTDGRCHVVAAYNPHYAERRSGLFDTSGLSVGAGARATDLQEGLQQPYRGSISLALDPDGFAFVLIAAPGEYAVPAGLTQARCLPPAYSAQPGMEFLRIEAPAEPASAEREKEPGRIYVGVFKSATSPPSGLDMGAEAMMAALKAQEGLVPEFIHSDSPAVLGFYDVIIIPNMKKRPPNLSERWQRNVRAFVEKGGGALLVHHSAGYPSTAQPAFPETATAPDYVAITTMNVVREHPVATGESIRKRFPQKAGDPAFEQYLRATQLRRGEQFQCGFADYIKLQPGPSAATVVKSAARGNRGGDPVVVAGSAGKGKVVLSGMNIGCRSSKVDDKYQFEEKLSRGEAAILVNSVFWLAEH